MQILVQEQGREELCPLAVQPPPVLVDDILTQPPRGLQTGFFQGLLFNVEQVENDSINNICILLFYNFLNLRAAIFHRNNFLHLCD